MSKVIARRNPVAFKTQALHVQASPEVLCYTPVGNPLSFDEMLALRQPVQIDNPESFELTVANLGVSADITLCWQQREFRLFSLERGELIEQHPRNLSLSEAFAPQVGWVVTESHCAWPDGLGHHA